MLSFQRRVVAALLSPIDAAHRPAAHAWVDGALRGMPEHLRLGVAADTVLLGTWARATHPRGLAEADLRALISRWETNPLAPVRQYARLLGSLALFAEHELGGEPEPAGATP